MIISVLTLVTCMDVKYNSPNSLRPRVPKLFDNNSQNQNPLGSQENLGQSY